MTAKASKIKMAGKFKSKGEMFYAINSILDEQKKS